MTYLAYAILILFIISALSDSPTRNEEVGKIELARNLNKNIDNRNLFGFNGANLVRLLDDDNMGNNENPGYMFLAPYPYRTPGSVPFLLGDDDQGDMQQLQSLLAELLSDPTRSANIDYSTNKEILMWPDQNSMPQKKQNEMYEKASTTEEKQKTGHEVSVTLNSNISPLLQFGMLPYTPRSESTGGGESAANNSTTTMGVPEKKPENNSTGSPFNVVNNQLENRIVLTNSNMPFPVIFAPWPQMTPSKSPSDTTAASSSTSYPTPYLVPTLTPYLTPQPTPMAIPTAMPYLTPALTQAITPYPIPQLSPMLTPTMVPSPTPMAIPTAIPYLTPRLTQAPTPYPTPLPTPMAIPTTIIYLIPQTTQGLTPYPIPQLTPILLPTMAPSPTPMAIPTAMPILTPQLNPPPTTLPTPQTTAMAIPTTIQILIPPLTTVAVPETTTSAVPTPIVPQIPSTVLALIPQTTTQAIPISNAVPSATLAPPTTAANNAPISETSNLQATSVIQMTPVIQLTTAIQLTPTLPITPLKNNRTRDITSAPNTKKPRVITTPSKPLTPYPTPPLPQATISPTPTVAPTTISPTIPNPAPPVDTTVYGNQSMVPAISVPLDYTMPTMVLPKKYGQFQYHDANLIPSHFSSSGYYEYQNQTPNFDWVNSSSGAGAIFGINNPLLAPRPMTNQEIMQNQMGRPINNNQGNSLRGIPPYFYPPLPLMGINYPGYMPQRYPDQFAAGGSFPMGRNQAWPPAYSYAIPLDAGYGQDYSPYWSNAMTGFALQSPESTAKISEEAALEKQKTETKPENVTNGRDTKLLRRHGGRIVGLSTTQDTAVSYTKSIQKLPLGDDSGAKKNAEKNNSITRGPGASSRATVLNEGIRRSESKFSERLISILLISRPNASITRSQEIREKYFHFLEQLAQTSTPRVFHGTAFRKYRQATPVPPKSHKLELGKPGVSHHLNILWKDEKQKLSAENGTVPQPGMKSGETSPITGVESSSDQ